MAQNNFDFDVLIIGSGAAGLALALSLSEFHRIAVVTKTTLLSSASQRAQGGIAAVMSELDSPKAHIQDTLIAGAGLCDERAVAYTVHQAKAAIQWLIAQGVPFTADVTGKFHLTREGGHSERRILHVADRTGAAVVATLAERVQSHPNIHCFFHTTAVDLLHQDGQCYGALFLDNQTERSFSLTAKATVLCTGGASQVYLHSTHHEEATGDGIAMAWRAGCRVGNLEFNQFHPTCFYSTVGQPFLISEALRGEGARLVLPNGQSFLERYDDRLELAPRDIVTRAIDQEMRHDALEHVYLDISHLPSDRVQQLFPTLYALCLAQGIDMTREAIPVVPAAHYTCGGVLTDLHGRADLKCLYVIGEAALTGLHGANRLASNSLLECVVFAQSAAQDILRQLSDNSLQSNVRQISMQMVSWNFYDNVSSKIKQLQTLMWSGMGIVREQREMQRTFAEISNMQQSALSKKDINCVQSPTLRNLLTVSELMVLCGLAREESRGLHFRQDFPQKQPVAQHSILLPGRDKVLFEQFLQGVA